MNIKILHQFLLVARALDVQATFINLKKYSKAISK